MRWGRAAAREAAGSEAGAGRRGNGAVAAGCAGRAPRTGQGALSALQGDAAAFAAVEAP